MKRTTIAMSFVILCAGCNEERGSQSPTTVQIEHRETLPSDFAGTWKPVLSARYEAKVKESYVKHRRPGMPSYEKWSSLGKGMARATWTFESGELVAKLGSEEHRAPFKILSQTDSKVVLRLKHERLGNIDLELHRVEHRALELRVSNSNATDAPPIRLVRTET